MPDGQSAMSAERDPRPPVLRDKMAPPEWYDNLDEGIRFPVKVLHAYGFETSQSCEGGPGHSYPEPTVDLHGGASEVPGFAVLHYLEAYGLEVRSIAEVWNVQRGRIHEVIWRVALRRAHPERADDWPMFVWGYRSKAVESQLEARDLSTAMWRRWRVGRKVGRTIYALAPAEASDVLIGLMDTPALAEEAVQCHNEVLGRVQTPEDSEHLLPEERLALLAAKGQLERGENPPINTTTVLVMALERLVGDDRA